MGTDAADVRGTEYLILEAKELTQPETITLGAQYIWIERETLFARSAQGAIKKHVASNGNQAGKYAAVPTRSWRLMKVKPETQTRLVFS